jgi:hypothetical protein
MRLRIRRRRSGRRHFRESPPEVEIARTYPLLTGSGSL